MKRNRFMLVLGLIVAASMLLSACGTPATQAPAATEAPVATEAPTEVVTEAPTEAPTEVPTPAPTTRKGGWLDEIVMTVVSKDSVITQLQAGAIDIYANGLSSADFPAIKEAGLGYVTNNGLYYDLMFNPAAFENGTLNPFSNRKIREATNWLIDRNYINQEVYAGGGLAKWFAITTQFPDYADLADTARMLEAKYAYNMDKAKEVITAEMTAMGATLGADGKWAYNGAPVSLIFLIRPDSDGTRKPIGDYIANQLEAVGFTVDRQYKKSSEAAPIWLGTAAKDGQWHIYTAAWSSTILDRDQSNIFQEMYLPSSAQGSEPFISNVPDPEFQKLGDDLTNAVYNTKEERKAMMEKALALSLQDSLQVFLIDGKNYIPFQNNVQVTYDLAAGVEGAQIWAYNIRFKDQEGGTLKWATQGLFGEPWNPLAGSNWAYDQGAIRATQSGDVMYDPYTGLVWPLRIEKAEVTVLEGLPVSKTADWVDLKFEKEIKVPEDAWVDWDATAQTFIPASTKFPDGLTAKRKTVVTYPADLYTAVKWHDGANLSIGDIVMGMILTFDRAKTESKIYDEVATYAYEPFMETFKGMKIVSTDPLVVEYYSDTYQLDAELNVPVIWPTYSYGEGSWDVLAIANAAEAAGELAYGVEKAGAATIEQTSFVGGPALEILAKYLDQAIADKLIPYAPTMSQYVTPEEAVARYEALKAWYAEHGHFWVGTGPYYLDKAFLTEQTLTLKSFADFPDLADRWARFAEPKIADVVLDGPGQVKIGEEATYDVSVTFKDAAYPSAEIKQVKFLLYNAKSEIVTVGEAALVEEGMYSIVLPADVTSKLEAGSNKLEIAVIPLVVSVPTFASLDFVTAP